MSQPKNFGFDEDTVMLRDAARRFFAEKLPVDKLHALVGDNPDPERPAECLWPQQLWQEMVELGWTSLSVPEAKGGLGVPLVAVAALVEESGRAAFPSPLLSTLQASYLLAACDTPAADTALAAILEGAAAAPALMDLDGSFEAGSGAVAHSDGKLSGLAGFVQDALKVEYLVVKAADEQGPGLFWVAAGDAGVERQADQIVDLTRDQATVNFSGAPAVLLSRDVEQVFTKALPAIYCLVAADMAGAAEWQLQTTVEYARTRKQFDRELGFFQAIKHPLVNVMIDIDQTRSLVYNAACAFDYEPERAAEFAHMAKSSASDMAALASSRSVQFHGGIGFTWECYVHLYFKRQVHNQLLWGDAGYHRAKLADIVIGPVAA